jgi:hypothetical protein
VQAERKVSNSFEKLFRGAACLIQRQCKLRAETNENEVFKFGYAETQPILSKDTASRVKNNQAALEIVFRTTA